MSVRLSIENSPLFSSRFKGTISKRLDPVPAASFLLAECPCGHSPLWKVPHSWWEVSSGHAHVGHGPDPTPLPLYPSLGWHDAGKQTGQRWNSPQCFQSNCPDRLTHHWTSWMTCDFMLFFISFFSIIILFFGPLEKLDFHPSVFAASQERDGEVEWSEVKWARPHICLTNYPSIYASSADANAGARADEVI